jgi:hypothetical protein
MITFIKYPVFVDKDKNRFIIPTIHSLDKDFNAAANAAMMCTVLGLQREDAPVVVTIGEDGNANLNHVVTTIRSHALANGSLDVLAIGGPVFESAHKPNQLDTLRAILKVLIEPTIVQLIDPRKTEADVVDFLVDATMKTGQYDADFVRKELRNALELKDN